MTEVEYKDPTTTLAYISFDPPRPVGPVPTGFVNPDQGKLTSLATHSAATPASLHLISACSLIVTEPPN